ncbi:MAG TPA: chromosome segregation protein SMC [Clostridiales bacterium]|nr:chromosome segregation protein SMC [Clostridiales bacterium]
MYLKSIEMQGFKSFPDKTVMRFEKGITAVVGPNGSGKSNIADAVKWVLGEQSTKSLRGNKMEDVVFGGTAKRRPQGYAEVVLRLDNSDNAIKSDILDGEKLGSEIIVSRKYYRSGESEYRINGNIVRLKDIHQLFMDTGLGPDGYSIVGQGRIESLVSAKSSERRDMFEEAAGISLYRHRREEAQRKLEQTEENLVRLRDILLELESRVGPLKTQSEKAKKFLRLAEEKREIEIGIWLNIIEKSSRQLKEYSDKEQIAKAQHEEILAELENIIRRSEEADSKTKEITLKLDELQKSISKFEEAITSFESQAAVAKNSLFHLESSRERLGKELSQENITKEVLTEQKTELLSQIEELKAEIEKKKSEISSITSELLTLKDKDDSFTQQFNALTNQLTEIERNLSEQRIAESSALSSAEEINKRKQELIESINDKKQQIKSLEEELKKAKAAKEECNENLESAENTVKGYAIKVRNASAAAENANKKLSDEQLKADRYRSRIKLLSDMEKNMEGYAGSVKAVMKRAHDGFLTGIHGPLSQLIKVESEYETAIETALGAALQNIVTDNENDAKKAINYLKESGEGRVTFFPLTSIKGRTLEEKGLENSRGFIAIASELVEYDKIYGEIIVSQLGRTVVVEDIDSAIEMARKYSHRFKIVTLDGQVINAGGSMTGGSKIRSGGFLSRSNEMESLKSRLAEIEKNLEALKQEAKQAQELYAREVAAFEGAQGEQLRAKEALIYSENQLSITESKYNDAVSALEATEQELQRLEQRLKISNDIALKAKCEIERLNAEKVGIQEKINLISSDRENLISTSRAIDERIAAINIDLAALNNELNSKANAAADIECRITAHDEKAEGLYWEINELKVKESELKNSIETYEANALELKAKITSIKAEMDKLIEERENAEKEVYSLRALERQKTAEKENISGELIRLQERIDSLTKEQADLENKLFEEYGLTKREAERLEIKIDSPQAASRRLSELKSQIKALGNVNLAAIEEYKEVSERYEFLSTQIKDVEKSKDELGRLINDLTQKMTEIFKEKFDLINMHFAEAFKQLFGGGDAKLILEDEENMLECGIEITAQPPGKSVKSLSLLSGGEKGLCAVSLLFAMLKVSPSPFCIFDEVDAALDDINVIRFASYVRSICDKTQFILITHRRGTMEEADLLYGVTMQEEGVSKLLELKTAEMAKSLGLE